MQELVLPTAELAQAHAMFPFVMADKSYIGLLYMMHMDTTAYTNNVAKSLLMPLLWVLVDASKCADASKPSQSQVVRILQVHLISAADLLDFSSGE